MRPKSRQFVLVALVLPGGLALVTLAIILLLTPFAPESIAMQWSTGGASRFAAPAELLFLPLSASASSLLIWAIASENKPRDTRIALIVGNSINALLNSFAVALLVSQLSGPAFALPAGMLALALIPVALVGLGTYFATRKNGR